MSSSPPSYRALSTRIYYLHTYLVLMHLIVALYVCILENIVGGREKLHSYFAPTHPVSENQVRIFREDNSVVVVVVAVVQEVPQSPGDQPVAEIRE